MPLIAYDLFFFPEGSHVALSTDPTGQAKVVTPLWYCRYCRVLLIVVYVTSPPAMCLQHWKKHTLGSTRKTHQPEDWVMWDVHSNKLLDDMARIYKPNTMRMVSSEFISWVLKIYFNIMGDLEHIGLGPFDCAEVNSLSTGMHAVFMAHLSCEIVNLYGMSYAGYLVYRRSAHTDGAHYEWVPHEHHAWEFDGFLIRLLHIAGKVSVCNRDDPTVSTIELMKIKWPVSRDSK